MAKRRSGSKKPGDVYQDAVGTVAKAVYPNAIVEIGQWIEGPDGERDLDVVVRPAQPNTSEFVVIECKDWRRPIGIGTIDALESKRRDLGAKLALICSNSGFTADALRKAARVGIPALAALIEGDARIRVVVREQIYTRSVAFVRSGTRFHHQNLSGTEQATLSAPLHTREYLYGGRRIEAWLADKWLRLVSVGTRSRAVCMRFIFRPGIIVTVRGVSLSVTQIEAWGEFNVQWMTQVAEIGASTGMYDYLKKRVVFGPGPHQFHLKNVNTQSWGRRVDIKEVPPRLLVPFDQRSAVPPPSEMSLALIKGLPGGDPKDAPGLDCFVANEEIIDDVVAAVF